MTFVFISNYLTLHQIPLCNALYEALGKEFLFVATMPMEKERVAMGWQEDQNYPYEASLSDADVQKRIDEADIVLIGSANDQIIQNRLHKGKIVLRYSERILKHGRWHALSPRAIMNVVTKHTVYRKAPVYLLCASAYAAGDYHLFGAYWRKSFQWGYFPEMISYSTKQIKALKNSDIPQILWVGRLLRWKHPELAISVADYLRQKGYVFHMNMIGAGEQEQQLRQLIHQKDLDEYVSILGFMKPSQVRSYMENANVFLITSDFQEGWGAVLNEAMNSGCAVVASHAIGSAPFLIKDGTNGYLFKNGDANDLCKKVETMLNDKSAALTMGLRAYQSIAKQWNAELAATRLIDFSTALVRGEHLPAYEEGPLSQADFLSNRWYK